MRKAGDLPDAQSDISAFSWSTTYTLVSLILTGSGRMSHSSRRAGTWSVGRAGLKEVVDDITGDAPSELRAFLVGVAEVKADEDARPVNVLHDVVKAAIVARRAG